MANQAAKFTVELLATYEKFTAGLKGAGRDLEAFASQAKGRIRESDDAFTTLLKGIKANEQQLKTLGTTMTAAGATMAAGIGVAVKQFADFEGSIARAVGAAGGGSQDFKIFGDAAKNMARELGAGGVTAKGAADALFSIASAGLKGTDAINVLRPALVLAAATQGDMAQTTEAVIATLTQFQLGTTEAARVTNVFAAANQVSLGSVAGFMEAMKQAGPAANLMGKSVEEAAAALAVMFNSGLKAEQAGTGLRNILTKLIDPSKEAQEALGSIGIAMADVDPRTRSLAEIIDVFRARQADATVTTKLFGQENLIAFEALRKVGGPALVEMQKNLTGTDAAARQLKTQMETGRGAIMNLRTQVELASIEMGDRFLQKLRPAIAGLADWTKSVTEASEGTKNLVAVIGVTATGATLIGGLTLLGIATLPRAVEGLKLLRLAVVALHPELVLLVPVLMAAAAAYKAIGDEQARQANLKAGGPARVKELEEQAAALRKEIEQSEMGVPTMPLLGKNQATPSQRAEVMRKRLREIEAELARTAPDTGSADFEAAMNKRTLAVPPGAAPRPVGAPADPGLANASEISRTIEGLVKNLAEAGLDDVEKKLVAVRLALAGASPELVAWAEAMVIASNQGDVQRRTLEEQSKAWEKHELHLANTSDTMNDWMVTEQRAIDEMAEHETRMAELAERTGRLSPAFMKLQDDVHAATRALEAQEEVLGASARVQELQAVSMATLGKKLSQLTAAERDYVERLVDAQRAGRQQVEISALIARGYTAEEAAALAASATAIRERQKQLVADRDYYGFAKDQLALLAIQMPTVWEGITTVVQQAAQNMTSALSDFLFNFITGTATASEAFVQFGKAMLRTITNFLAEQAVKTLFKLAGVAFDAISSPISVSTSSIMEAAKGGVAGLGSLGGGIGDVIPAMLSRGEMILNADATQKLLSGDFSGLLEQVVAIKDKFMGGVGSAKEWIGNLLSGKTTLGEIGGQVGNFVSANPGFTASSVAGLVALALQFSGNDDAAKAGQILGALAPIIGPATSIAVGAISGATGVALGTSAAAVAGASAGSAAAGATAALGTLSPLGPALAAAAIPFIPIILGGLLTGNKDANPVFPFPWLQDLERTGRSDALDQAAAIRRAILSGDLSMFRDALALSHQATQFQGAGLPTASGGLSGAVAAMLGTNGVPLAGADFAQAAVFQDSEGGNLITIGDVFAAKALAQATGAPDPYAGLVDLNDLSARPGLELQSLKYGGVVSGPLGSPQLVVAHGGEEFAGVGRRVQTGRTTLIFNVPPSRSGMTIEIDDVEEVLKKAAKAGRKIVPAETIRVVHR